MSKTNSAKVSGRIESAARDTQGKPSWAMEKDGSLVIAQRAVDSATIKNAKITG